MVVKPLLFLLSPQVVNLVPGHGIIITEVTESLVVEQARGRRWWRSFRPWVSRWVRSEGKSRRRINSKIRRKRSNKCESKIR